MKKSISFLLAILLVFGLFTVSAFAIEAEEEVISPQSLPFTDVGPGNWFYRYVQRVYEENVMQGTGSTTFAPHGTFSRAQIVATLFRIYHGRVNNASDPRESHFRDVAPNNWFAPYVYWAYTNYISRGVSTARFGPNDSVARQEIAGIIYNFAVILTDIYPSAAANATWNAFTDRGQICCPFCYDALLWANNRGIIRGRTPTTIIPTGTATRAEAATMLVRLMDLKD